MFKNIMYKTPNLGYIKEFYTNKKIKKIVNVYQKQYTNIKGQGFGDFLRGSIFLTYICLVLNLEFDIDLKNHPLSNLLEINEKIYNVNYSNIYAIIDYGDHTKEKSNVLSFINLLNNWNGEICYIFINCIPRFPIENPIYGIIQPARKVIIPKIEAKQYILDILDKKLTEKGLSRKNYIVIHVRCGDYFMNIKKNIDTEKHKISSKHINDIVKILKNNCGPKKKYIIVGDSNEIKKEISSKFSNMIVFDTEITHLGEDTRNNEKALIETLLDFNIMRFSNFIVSFTAYGHGSGFSRYCASIYNIPFRQVILQPTLEYRV